MQERYERFERQDYNEFDSAHRYNRAQFYFNAIEVLLNSADKDDLITFGGTKRVLKILEEELN